MGMRASPWILGVCLAVGLASCGRESGPSGNADQPPSLGTVTPESGSGKTQTFTTTYSHPDGAKNVLSAWFLVEKSPTGTKSCFLQYGPANNSVNLMTDAGQ